MKITPFRHLLEAGSAAAGPAAIVSANTEIDSFQNSDNCVKLFGTKICVPLWAPVLAAGAMVVGGGGKSTDPFMRRMYALKDSALSKLNAFPPDFVGAREDAESAEGAKDLISKHAPSFANSETHRDISWIINAILGVTTSPFNIEFDRIRDEMTRERLDIAISLGDSNIESLQQRGLLTNTGTANIYADLAKRFERSRKADLAVILFGKAIQFDDRYVTSLEENLNKRGRQEAITFCRSVFDRWSFKENDPAAAKILALATDIASREQDPERIVKVMTELNDLLLWVKHKYPESNGVNDALLAARKVGLYPLLQNRISKWAFTRSILKNALERHPENYRFLIAVQEMEMPYLKFIPPFITALFSKKAAATEYFRLGTQTSNRQKTVEYLMKAGDICFGLSLYNYAERAYKETLHHVHDKAPLEYDVHYKLGRTLLAQGEQKGIGDILHSARGYYSYGQRNNDLAYFDKAERIFDELDAMFGKKDVPEHYLKSILLGRIKMTMLKTDVLRSRGFRGFDAFPDITKTFNYVRTRARELAEDPDISQKQAELRVLLAEEFHRQGSYEAAASTAHDILKMKNGLDQTSRDKLTNIRISSLKRIYLQGLVAGLQQFPGISDKGNLDAIESVIRNDPMISKPIKEIRTQEVLFEETLPAILRGSKLKPRNVIRLSSRMAKRRTTEKEAKARTPKDHVK